MQVLHFGLVGCGNPGRVRAACLADIAGASFTAYADVSAAAAQQCLDQFGGTYATADPARLFADDAIDAVYISTQHDSHATLAVAAARAGKHIFMEKPLALSD